MDYNSEIKDFFKRQLAVWELAGRNYADLKKCDFREMKLGNARFRLMHNPGRIQSCAAKVDAASIKERKCFLCKANRPDCQLEYKIDDLDGFTILVNPFPICDPHFTIVADDHIPQDHVPECMELLAQKFSDYVIFFNGASSGASAPDHLHLQMVRQCELPMLSWLASSEVMEKFPYEIRHLKGSDARSGINNLENPDMSNVFMWIDCDGLLNSVIIPRQAHRPSCYYSTGEDSLLVSPGALDMGGLVVLPRPGDLEKITPDSLLRIFEETGIIV